MFGAVSNIFLLAIGAEDLKLILPVLASIYLSSKCRVRNSHLKRHTSPYEIYRFTLVSFFLVSQEPFNYSLVKSSNFDPIMFPVSTTLAPVLTLSFLYAAVLVYSQSNLCIDDDLLLSLQANREAAELFCRAQLEVPDIFTTYLATTLRRSVFIYPYCTLS